MLYLSDLPLSCISKQVQPFVTGARVFRSMGDSGLAAISRRNVEALGKMGAGKAANKTGNSNLQSVLNAGLRALVFSVYFHH